MTIKKRVFLGGTCNESTWRNQMMIHLHEIGLEYFNPVVDDWDESAYQMELHEREHCDYCLYVITPKMSGAYSIAEVVDDSNKRSDKTVFVVLEEDKHDRFTSSQMKSLRRVAKLVEGNGGKYFDNLKCAANHMGEKQ